MLAQILKILLGQDLKINLVPIACKKPETGAVTSKVIPHENSNERSFQLQEIVEN
jgi:hypothetical protein